MAYISNAPDGLSSFGYPLLPGGGPIMPTIPPALGAPCYFVSGDLGSDGYDGLTPQTPLKTLDVAFGKCTSGYNQIVYVLGGVAAVSLSSAYPNAGVGLLWNKNHTHLIGLAAPVALGQRARVGTGASTVLMTPFITVSGRGCYFSNINFQQNGSHATTAAVCLKVSGQNNAFVNCQIAGGLAAAAAANAAMRSLVIDAGAENLFYHCYIGTTTQQRGSTSSEIEIKTAAARNIFERCKIVTASGVGVTGTLLLSIGATGMQDFTHMEDCTFIVPGSFQGGGTPASALSINAAPGGVLMLKNCLAPGTAVLTAVQGTPSGAVFADNPGSAAGVKGVAATS